MVNEKDKTLLELVEHDHQNGLYKFCQKIEEFALFAKLLTESTKRLETPSGLMAGDCSAQLAAVTAAAEVLGILISERNQLDILIASAQVILLQKQNIYTACLNGQ